MLREKQKALNEMRLQMMLPVSSLPLTSQMSMELSNQVLNAIMQQAWAQAQLERQQYDLAHQNYEQALQNRARQLASLPAGAINGQRLTPEQQRAFEAMRQAAIPKVPVPQPGWLHPSEVGAGKGVQTAGKGVGKGAPANPKAPSNYGPPPRSVYESMVRQQA